MYPSSQLESNNQDGPSTSPIPSTSTHDSRHVCPRVFIGPMPDKVILQLEQQVKRSKTEGVLTLSQLEEDAPEEHEDIVEVVRGHAKRFVAHHKDKLRREDSRDDAWTEDDEYHVAEDLIRKWRESEWGKAWSQRDRRRHRPDTGCSTGSSHWVGGSFEIGSLLGMNVLVSPQSQETQKPHSDLPRVAVTRAECEGPQEQSNGSDSPGDSQARLIPSPSSGLSPIARGKQRAVHSADESNSSLPPSTPSATNIDLRSSQEAMLPPSRDIIMRDRMLVRAAHSKYEGLNPKFDDSMHRTTHGLQYEDWGEFMVVWRRDCIEIYEDHWMPGRALMSDSKHLAFVIPIRSNRTTLSLYSFVDLTFCMTCPPTSTRLNSSSRSIFGRSKEGTNIFIFKHKSRSRSWDWIWKLWRHRGGELPPSVAISNPRTNGTVKVEVPFRREVDTKELFDMFTRENITNLCMKSLELVPDWFALVQREISQNGRRLELCWRRDASLDWVWLEEDAFGNARPWVVMAGLAVAQSTRPPVLEIRLTSHAQTHYHLRDGTHMDEPPSIEGYVDRIKPNSQFRHSIYLSTRNGLLLFQTPEKAYPPCPPGLALTSQDLDAWIDGLRGAEVERGVNQVMHSYAACDLRDIVVVRRAFQVLPPLRHDHKDATPSDDPIWLEISAQPEAVTLDDDEDEGGEAGLLHASDKPMVRVRRSFELLLNTGHVLRFEVNSRKVAVEWVNRLRLLISFWKHKHRIDAKEEMELVQARRPRLTPQMRVCNEEEYPPEAPADMAAPYAATENLYNWCIIEGCTPITKGGKVFVRKGLRGQYRLVQLLLVAGHLIRYKITPGSCVHRSTGKKINLLDAYVFSGYFAALTLPKGQWSPNKPAAPRRYQDGLETDDREEDMLFMILYRPQPAQTEAEHTPVRKEMPMKVVPTLSAKRKVLVIRTRSRIERDAWCFALNTEIERIVRVQREREERMRETGSLKDL